MLRVTLISPYHGGSHRAWATGYQQYSRHKIDLLTLPAHFWKWRMHGGAVTLARRFLDRDLRPDLLLVTDMLDLTTFLALTRPLTDRVPVILYMHENQLTYPLPADGATGPMRRQRGERDLHYAFINYTSMLAADRILFNSAFHRDGFFAALPRFLGRFPEYRELGSVERLAARAEVLPVGVDFGRLDSHQPPLPDRPPLIVWNQRWEYDKNPEGFFQALLALVEAGIPFRLALCGRQYGRAPAVFEQASTQLASSIVHSGYAPLADYRDILWRASVVVSTAHHEFFGISILEAIHCHTFPLLPQRLSYPELIPPAYQDSCLYSDEEELSQRLRQLMSQPEAAAATARKLAATADRYSWFALAPRYDEMLSGLVDQN